MPLARVVLLTLFLVACPGPGGTATDGGSGGGSSTGGGTGGSAGGSAGGGAGGGSGGGSVADAGPMTNGFSLVTPSVPVDAGTVATWCWFFRTPNGAAERIRAFHSSHGGAAEYIAVWLTPTEMMPAGTTTSDCAQFVQNATWAYSSWTPDAGWEFPQDDGTGKPLGKGLAANQPGYVYVQVTNGSGATLPTNARVDVELYPADAGVTAADSFITYNTTINVPAQATVAAAKTCSPPAGAQFTRMSMYAHKQATLLEATGSQAMLFMGNDWQNPGAATWSAPSFAATPTLESRCTYTNSTPRVIHSGASLDSDEECMVLSYFFPSSRPRLCIDAVLLP